ncbi:hypothetical protein HOK51_09560 [Candidatus Woesearchaeota archaeon]|jgi:hypothetical protein|nr:hypothetical protein [Candidatus Woesearchaeota archaeon]MBT6520069.1 hypothetical protein [Candidatus Woesearchaeota archaeon]MBT7366674.1 hypothetical protein [Candidatus Woesearchaeota archaeon]
MKLRYLVMLVVLLLVVGCGCETTPEPASASEPSAPAPAAPVAEPEPAPAPIAPAAEQGVPVAVDEEGVPVEMPEAGEGTELTNELEAEDEEKGIAVDATPDSTEFSEVVCADGAISVKLVNAGEGDWVLAKTDGKKINVGIMNRGLPDPTPGCAKAVLAPGESTICSEIDMGVYPGENRVAINSPDGTFVRIVNCPELEAEV